MWVYNNYTIIKVYDEMGTTYLDYLLITWLFGRNHKSMDSVQQFDTIDSWHMQHGLVKC